MRSTIPDGNYGNYSTKAAQKWLVRSSHISREIAMILSWEDFMCQNRSDPSLAWELTAECNLLRNVAVSYDGSE